MRRPFSALIAMAALAGALLVPAGASAAPSPAATNILYVGVGECWADVDDAVVGTTVTFLLRRPNGTLKAKASDVVGDQTSAGVCFSTRIAGGDTLVLRSGGKTLRTLAIHRLSIAPNRTTDQVGGTGKAGDELTIGRGDCTVEGRACTDSDTKTITVGPQGTWSWGLSGIQDITGGDRFNLDWVSPKGDHASIDLRAPNLAAFVGRAGVTGFAKPGSSVTVKLFRSSVRIAKGTATATIGSTYAITLRDGAGKAVKVAEGDVVKSSIAADAILPATVTIGIVDDGIEGRCLPDVDARLTLASDGGEAYSYTHTDAEGDYAFTALDLATRGGAVATVLCTSDAGDSIGRRLTIPVS